jgi:hypothetical protein
VGAAREESLRGKEKDARRMMWLVGWRGEIL